MSLFFKEISWVFVKSGLIFIHPHFALPAPSRGRGLRNLRKLEEEAAPFHGEFHFQDSDRAPGVGRVCPQKELPMLFLDPLSHFAPSVSVLRVDVLGQGLAIVTTLA